ncbi:MAG: glutathione S-transferase family protein, partial [Pseudomonadota bacterium]
AAFQQISPRAEVPVFVHGDLSIYDSSIILEYIEEQWPAPALLPAKPQERARVRLLEEVMDTHFEANTWGLGEITFFGRAQGEQAVALRAFAESEINRWYTWLDQQLGQADWFNGASFGWGDMAVVPFVHGAVRFDIQPAADSALAAWYTRASERDSVIQCRTAAEGAELDSATMTAAIAQGFRREYRDHRLEWMVRAGGLNIVEAGIRADNLRFHEAFL